MNRLKNILILCLVSFMASKVSAQQIPSFTSYTVNPFLLSPSFAGSADGLRMFGISRLQYVNIQGAPKTYALMLDGPIASYNMALGGGFYTDEAGPLRQTGMALSYAYKLKLGDDLGVNLGVGLDVAQQSIDFTGFEQFLAQDETLLQNRGSKVFADANFGIHASYKNLNVGFAVPKLFATKILYEDVISDRVLEYEFVRHYTAFASYELELKPDVLDLEPILVMRTADRLEPQVDFTVRGTYKDAAYLSVGYRSEYALTFGAGVFLSDKFLVGYGFDYALHEISNFSAGTHEIMLGLFPGSGGGDGMSRRQLNKLIDQKQKEEGERVRSMYDTSMNRLKERVEGLEERNKQQQAEIDSLQAKMDGYQSDLDAYKKDLEARNKEIIDRWRDKGLPATSGGSGSGTTSGKAGASGQVGQSQGSSNDGGSLSEPPGQHVVVEASFRLLSEAITYQQILRRNGDNRNMRIMRSDNGRWYFVYELRNTSDNREEAQKTLNSMSREDLVPRMYPWIYSQYKVK